jgi:hypothetical protein
MTKQLFAILRVQPVKARKDLVSATRHGRREDDGQHYDAARTPFNRHWGAGGPVVDPVDWAEGVDCAIKRLGAATRKGAPVAAEFFVGASPEYFDPPDADADGHFDMKKVLTWADSTMAAFYKRFGRAVVAARLDLDEGSPHMAVCVLPVYTKTTKHTQKTAVSYRQVFGGSKQESRTKMIAVQDWYAEEMAPLGLSRGIARTITGRTHLSHQEYARKRRREDEERALALLRAQEREAQLAARLTEIEQELELARQYRTVAHGNAQKAVKALLEARHANTFIQSTARTLAAYDPHAPIVGVMASKARVLATWEADIQRVSDELDDMDSSYPRTPQP